MINYSAITYDPRFLGTLRFLCLQDEFVAV